MKTRTPLKRKTPLKSKSGLKAKTPLKKRATGQIKPKKGGIKRLQKKLWEECKRITRLRYQNFDGTWNCFTCGAHLDVPVKCQTGHFIPSSICSTEMRYDLDNLRIQDYRCNINLSGNWVEYEKRLDAEKGEGFAKNLKKRNEVTKNKQYDSLWYIQKIEEYKNIQY